MRKYILLIFLLMLVSQPAAASESLAVNAKAAVLIDGASGRILYAKNENEKLPMASCTKIMTALLALENSELDDQVTAGKNAHGVSGTSIYLSEGETLSMEQMLYGLMLRSGNDAAVAIAEHISGSIADFAALANERSVQLHADASFANPHGLDAENHAASALGLARIMREALKNPDFRTITGTQKKIIPWVGNEYSRVLENKNRLLGSYEGATGGKTGYTSKAGRCLVFSAARNGMELIGTVLNCYTWFDTAEALLDHGFEHFQMETALSRGQIAAQAAVLDGTSASVGAAAAEELSGAVGIGSKAEVKTELFSLRAPVEEGQVIGKARLLDEGEVVDECELIASTAVPAWSLGSAILNVFRNWALRLG